MLAQHSPSARALAGLVAMVSYVTALPWPAHLETRQDPPKLQWAVVGDSWASGVAYDSNTRYDNKGCYRSTEAWGAQMAGDTSWLAQEQDFKFAACGGSLMGAVNGQLGEVNNPSVVWGMFGGNNVFFGDIARACIYQPRPGGWGPYWDEDPNSEGYCKKNIQKAADYMNDESSSEGFRQEFASTLDGIFGHMQGLENAPEQFDLYVSSYARFFDDTTDECSEWTFAHPWVSAGKPKVVKGLRQVINEKTDQLNRLQAEAIRDYSPSRENYKIHNVQPNDVFQGHRFCEPGHSFEDQFYRDDVWMWNLQYYNTKDGALSSDPREEPKTEDGVTFMTGSTDQPPEAGMVLATFPISEGAAPADAPNPEPQSQSSFGWTARPFHPKLTGNAAMKDIFIQQMKNDRIPGVKVEEQDPPPQDPPTVPEEKIECFGLGGKKYANREHLRDVIENKFCPEAVAQGVLDHDSGSISRRYDTETVEGVALSISWQPGLDFKPDSDNCKRLLLGRLVDGCDGNDPNNPMNWKGGGKATVGDVTYEVIPMSDRQPFPTDEWAGCDSTYKLLWNEYVVWGSGWANTDFGNGLRGEVSGCALLPDTWNFEYGLGDDGREWTAKFRTGVFQKRCVGNAIGTAGSIDGFGCNGSG